jgi:hypothetical protein
MSSSSEFYFHDELASLFAQQQRPAPAGDMVMQQQPSSFADFLQAGTPMPMGTDYDMLCRALDLPVASAADVVKRELVVDTGRGGARTPSTAPVTPNTTSSISSSSSEAAGRGRGGGLGGGGGFGAGEEDSCQKEEGAGEEIKESGKGDQEDGDRNKKG